MFFFRAVIFTLDEPNLTRILAVFKENLGKYKGKRTSRKSTFILFLILHQKPQIKLLFNEAANRLVTFRFDRNHIHTCRHITHIQIEDICTAYQVNVLLFYHLSCYVS